MKMASAKIVFVLGAPGAGKGTQCAKIVDKYGWKHLSAGDLLRKEVSDGSELGLQAKELMENGEMVPTSLVLDLLVNAMTTSGSEAFLIDGFPRKLDQLQAFEEKIKPCDGVLVFTVPDDVAVERLVKRGESSGRADDNEETIRKRMEVFKEESQPVIDALKGSGRVAEINAEGSPDAVFIGVEAFMDPMVEVKASEDDPQVEKEDDDEDDALTAEEHVKGEEAPAEHHAEAEEAPAEQHAEVEKAPAEHHAEAKEAPAEHHEVEEAPAEHHAEAEEAPAEHHAEVEEAPAEHHAEVEDTPAEHHAEAEEAPAEHHAEVEEAPAEHHAEVEEAPAEHHEAEEALPASSHTVDPSSRIVFVLGAPGAGKGTQCARIVQHYGWSHLSTGDLLRKEVSEGTALGVQASSIMKEGGMVPTALILDLLIAAMASSPAGSSFLVDGFPRKLDQLQDFEAKIKPCDGVLAFIVPDDVAVERLVKRGESSGRADDNEETIRKRMEVFKEESQPVIDALKGSGRVAEIDAQGAPEDIFVEVRKFVDVMSGVTATEHEHHGEEVPAEEAGVQPEAHNEVPAEEAGVQPEAHNEEVPAEEAGVQPEAHNEVPVEEAAARAEDDVGDDSPPSAAAAAPVEEAAAGAEDDVGDDSPPSAAAAAPVEDLPDVAQFSQKEVDAVVKIQAGARGMLGRKRVKKIKGHSGQVEASSNETGQEEEGADEDGLEMQQEEGEEEQDAPPEALLEEPPAHVAETVAESKPEVQDLQVEEDTSTTTAPPVIQPVPPSQSKPTTPQRPVSSSPRPGSKPSVPPAAAAAAAPPEVLPAPTHTPPTLPVQPPVNQRAASIARATPTKTLPVRQYMDMTVVPILREALRSLNDSRPNDPLQFLADYLLAARAKRLNGGAQP